MLGGVHIGLSEEHGTFIGSYFKKRKSMLPEELHVIPMLNDSVRERIFELIQSSFVAGEFFADVGF